jgi:hypothetical protein
MSGIKIVAHLTVSKWDTDGEKVKLPKKLKLELEIEDDDPLDVIHEAAMDKASDEYGWCIDTCYLTRIDIK